MAAQAKARQFFDHLVNQVVEGAIAHVASSRVSHPDFAAIVPQQRQRPAALAQPNVPAGRIAVLHAFGDHDLVQRALHAIQGRWRQATLGVGTVTGLEAAWRLSYRQAEDELHAVVVEALLRGASHRYDIRVTPLAELGAMWLDRYASTLFTRRIAVPLTKALEQITDGIDEARERRDLIAHAITVALDQFVIVMQPMLRRLLIAAMLYALRPFGPKQAKAKAKPHQRALAIGNYVIVTQADDKVCPVCEYMATVGEFSLEDANALLDSFTAAADDGDIASALDDFSPFLSEADVEDTSVQELTEQGTILPPFHVNCRCNIALV